MRVRVVLGLVVIAVLAWAAWRYSGPRPVETSGSSPDSAGVGIKATRLYFASPTGDSLVSESRELPEAQSLHERVTALVSELDRGPTAGGVAALPAGTSVIHVYLDDRGLLFMAAEGRRVVGLFHTTC